jgi:hypothetical protein
MRREVIKTGRADRKFQIGQVSCPTMPSILAVGDI